MGRADELRAWFDGLSEDERRSLRAEQRRMDAGPLWPSSQQTAQSPSQRVLEAAVAEGRSLDDLEADRQDMEQVRQRLAERRLSLRVQESRVAVLASGTPPSTAELERLRFGSRPVVDRERPPAREEQPADMTVRDARGVRARLDQGGRVVEAEFRSDVPGGAPVWMDRLRRRGFAPEVIRAMGGGSAA